MLGHIMILADGRWQGAHGIGRFSTEVLTRLHNTHILKGGPAPLSAQNLLWQAYHLRQVQKHYSVFFTPGFNPVSFSALPFVMTIHDLIHLHTPGKWKILKKSYYETLIKPAIKKAFGIITISHYSKNAILNWAPIASEKISVIHPGISKNLTPHGAAWKPGYPYLLHVGNITKSHKNVERLIQAFQNANIERNIKLILTGKPYAELLALIQKNKLVDRIVFSGALTEDVLAEYYRGALALVFPSLHEGFGLPPLEAMACGIPALTSNVTAIPEATGDAALLIEPMDIDAIRIGIEKITQDAVLRQQLITRGLKHVKLFNWDNTAAEIQTLLNSAC
jgi:glycosyltransferase involved in cell wall biosynthesis